jgi:hypothetical protein
MVFGCGLDCTGPGYGPVVDFYEDENEHRRLHRC